MILPFIYSFFSDFLFVYSFYVSFWLHNGITVDKIPYLLITIQFTKLLCDIPLGFLADRFTRKYLVILGLLVRCLFCVLCLLKLNFYICSVLWGFSMSCIFSRADAYFYDNLKQKRQQKKFPVFMGRYYAFSNIAIGLAGLLGAGVFSLFNYQGIFLFSILSLVIAILLLLSMPNDYNYLKTQRKPNETLKNKLQRLKKCKNLKKLVLFSALLDTIFIVFLDLNTTLLNSYGISAGKISLIVGIISTIRIFTNYFSGAFEKTLTARKINSILSIYLSMFLCSLLILYLLSVNSSIASLYLTSISIALYLIIYPLFDTSMKSKIQKETNTNTRATVLSIISFCTTLEVILFNFYLTFIFEN